MKLLKQTDQNCLLYSACMVFNITPEQAITLLGHDGSEIIEGTEQRSFHIDEILDLGLQLGYKLMPIARWPALQYPSGKVVLAFDDCKSRFLSRIYQRYGILILSNPAHACAWNGQLVYDPCGQIYELDQIDSRIRECWVL